MGDTDVAVETGLVIGPTSSHVEPLLHIRIYVPDLDLQMLMQFKPDETAWSAKQKLLADSCRSLKDGMNYGLYCPPSNGKSGKFLDEERPLKDYPLPGPIGSLEFKYKKREFKTMSISIVKQKKLQVQTNLKQFLECVRRSDIDAMTKWTNRGLDPNYVSLGKGETPLTLAATLPRPRGVMLALVSGGAYLDFRNGSGHTALHVAAQIGNRDAIRTLLDLGASPNYKDTKGLTPIFHCVLNDTNAQCAQMLLHDHAEIGTKDDNGWTEIHHACQHGRVQHLEHLIFYGADGNAQTSTGDTPLHICAKYNKEECARVLLFRGASKTLKNNSNQDPYEVAMSLGKLNMADLIRKFQPEDVVLFHELPKYNEKRRGTISAATVRNLQRSRSNPQLHLLFQQEGWYTTSLSNATSQPYLANGFVGTGFATTGRSVQSPTTRTTSIKEFDFSQRQAARIVTLQREADGFGFTLRGAIANSTNFSPSLETPSSQYLASVEKGSVAERAGLQTRDYVIEVNGENVVRAMHDYVVDLLTKSGDQLTLKVVSVKTSKPDYESRTLPPPSVTLAAPTKVSEETRTLTPNSSAPSNLDGLEELERLDAALDGYDANSSSSSSRRQSASYSATFTLPEYQQEYPIDIDVKEKVTEQRVLVPIPDYTNDDTNGAYPLVIEPPAEFVATDDSDVFEKDPEPEPDYEAVADDVPLMYKTNVASGLVSKKKKVPTATLR